MSAVLAMTARIGIGCFHSPTATNCELPANTSPLINVVSRGVRPLSAEMAPRISPKGITPTRSGSICHAPSRNSARHPPHPALCRLICRLPSPERLGKLAFHIGAGQPDILQGGVVEALQHPPLDDIEILAEGLR